MPANTSCYIQQFINQSQVTDVTLNDTLRARVGLNRPGLYRHPTEQDAKDVKELCKTLQEFELNALAKPVNDAKTKALLEKLNTLVQQLELEIVRPQESGVDKDWVMLIPKIKNFQTPVRMCAALLYRFGLVIDQPTITDAHTVNNLGVLDEHSWQDGTERLVGDLFRKGTAKFALINLLKPHAVKNPNYNPQTDNKRIQFLSNPVGSATTIFLPMVTQLLQVQFREMPVMLMHGMAATEGPRYQVLMGNAFGRFRRDGWKSFANMLGISFGIEDYAVNNNPAQLGVVAVCSQIPNYVLKGDKTVPMSPTKPKLMDGALRWPGGTINTNINGHLGYFAETPYSLSAPGYKLPSDRMIHIENTSAVRNENILKAPSRDKFVNVVLRALNMYRYYDPAIHDPHQLAKRFKDQAKNMKLYPSLFSPEAIAKYKADNKAIYDKDTAAYKKTFAASKQMPPPLDTPVVKPVAVTKTTAKVTKAKVSQPLLFARQKSGTEEAETKSYNRVLTRK